MPNGETIEQAEEKAFKQLSEELKAHVELLQLAHNLVGKVELLIPERPLKDTPHSLIVATNLMIRLANDLRCIRTLALQGYPLQALSVASATYETAFTVVYIDADEALAVEWMDHEDPTQPFRYVWTLTRGGLANLGMPNAEEQAKEDYKAYRQMCWAKHINPVLQGQFGFQLIGQKFIGQNGPDVSPEAVRAAWWALDRTGRLAFLALCGFINSHIPEESRHGIVDEVQVLGAKRQELAQVAIQRWGNKDPFEGKW